MDDGVEPFLEIDTFGEAIGGNEKRFVCFTKKADVFFSFVCGELSGDDTDGDGRKTLGKVFS